MALIIEVKAVPSSGRLACKTDKSGIIKCYLKSPPEGGKANAELIKFFSKKLRIPKENITILTGATSRKKRIKIDGAISFEDFCEVMELEIQQSIG